MVNEDSSKEDFDGSYKFRRYRRRTDVSNLDIESGLVSLIWSDIMKIEKVKF